MPEPEIPADELEADAPGPAAPGGHEPEAGAPAAGGGIVHGVPANVRKKPRWTNKTRGVACLSRQRREEFKEHVKASRPEAKGYKQRNLIRKRAGNVFTRQLSVDEQWALVLAPRLGKEFVQRDAQGMFRPEVLAVPTASGAVRPELLPRLPGPVGRPLKPAAPYTKQGKVAQRSRSMRVGKCCGSMPAALKMLQRAPPKW